MTVQQIEAFKRENDLSADGDGESAAVGADFDDEIDLRAEDDALIAAELEAEQAQAEAEAAEEEEAEPDEEAAAARRSRRGRRPRSRRGGARAGSLVLEGTFDHGEEGYGLWLDPAVQDDPVYAEYWAGHRPVELTVEEDQIVIRRTGEDSEESE